MTKSSWALCVLWVILTVGLFVPTGTGLWTFTMIAAIVAAICVLILSVR